MRELRAVKNTPDCFELCRREIRLETCRYMWLLKIPSQRSRVQQPVRIQLCDTPVKVHHQHLPTQQQAGPVRNRSGWIPIASEPCVHAISACSGHPKQKKDEQQLEV